MSEVTPNALAPKPVTMATPSKAMADQALAQSKATTLELVAQQALLTREPMSVAMACRQAPTPLCATMATLCRVMAAAHPARSSLATPAQRRPHRHPTPALSCAVTASEPALAATTATRSAATAAARHEQSSLALYEPEGRPPTKTPESKSAATPKTSKRSSATTEIQTTVMAAARHASLKHDTRVQAAP